MGQELFHALSKVYIIGVAARILTLRLPNLFLNFNTSYM
jgi:hypothetical protein